MIPLDWSSMLALAVLGIGAFLWWEHQVRFSLRGKVVLVTGGAMGLGKAMAQRFAQVGAKVMLWDVAADDLRATQRELSARGGLVRCEKVDVTDRGEVLSKAVQLQEMWGHVSVVVNNAGIVIAKPVLQYTEQDAHKLLDVNLTAHLWTVQALLPAMLEKDDGHIVTMASAMSQMYTADLGLYCASKAGAAQLHRCLSLEVQRAGRRGVGTTLVCPWQIDTGMFQGAASKLQWLLPPLTVNAVARRVVDAVQRRELEVWVPAWHRLAVHALNMFPVRWVDFLVKLGGGFHAMKNFVGRRGRIAGLVRPQPQSTHAAH